MSTRATVNQGITIEGAANLDGVTLNENLNVAGTNVSIQNGLVLNGTITLGSDTAASELSFDSLSGNGSVIFTGTENSNLGGNIVGSLPRTIGPNIAINITPGVTAVIGLDTTIVDAGAIQVESGGTLSIDGVLNTARTIDGGGTINVLVLGSKIPRLPGDHFQYFRGSLA